jgi:hypothetical protein
MNTKPLENHLHDPTEHETLHKPVANTEAMARGDEPDNNPMSAHAPAYAPAPGPGPRPDPASAALELRLSELLGDRTPDDWDDPTAVALRISTLEHAAHDAADGMVELLVRLKEERKQGVHMSEGGCVFDCTNATFQLHRALTTYRMGTLRHDGEHLAYDSIARAYGRGVASLVMRALAELRILITRDHYDVAGISNSQLRI